MVPSGFHKDLSFSLVGQYCCFILGQKCVSTQISVLDLQTMGKLLWSMFLMKMMLQIVLQKKSCRGSFRYNRQKCNKYTVLVVVFVGSKMNCVCVSCKPSLDVAESNAYKLTFLLRIHRYFSYVTSPCFGEGSEFKYSGWVSECLWIMLYFSCSILCFIFCSYPPLFTSQKEKQDKYG